MLTEVYVHALAELSAAILYPALCGTELNIMSLLDKGHSTLGYAIYARLCVAMWFYAMLQVL